MITVNQTPSIVEEVLIESDVSAQHYKDQRIMAGQWKGKGKATTLDNSDTSTTSETLAVDWTKYEPPEGLTYTGDIESDTILQIIQESIDKIKARILEEEEERKTAAEAVRRKQEEAASQESEKAKQSESTKGRLDEESGQVDELDRPASPKQDTSRTDDTRSFPSVLLRRPRKRTLMNLFRKLNSGPERGESSAAGAARHRLLVSPSQIELTTPSARKRFVLDIIKKATGEETGNSPASSIQGPEVECVSCLDDFNPNDTIRAPCHNYCKPCFSRLVASACQNEQHWPPKCCLNNIPAMTIIKNIDDDLQRTYRERTVEWNINVADRIYCSRPNCSLFIRPEYTIPAQGVARCTDGHYTCIICRNAQHDGDNCPQDRDMVRTNELAEEEGWKRCYGCHAYVEHREACQHMTCLCGAEFCYVCGARWRTCACTMTQLSEVKHQADLRRQARLIKEAQDEAELQEAIRLVEEFEREEALKAELLRQEQERLAEERRRKELEEHIRREGERRKAVAAKYEALREVLAELHETQRSVVQRDQEEREAQLELKSDTELRSLLERHRAEHGWLVAKVEAKIAKREAVLKAEYAARIVEEREIEGQYAAKLQAFWRAKEGGEEKVQAAMLDLKRKMDKGFAAWKKWMENELERYCHHMHEELDIREELMKEQRRRLEIGACEGGYALAKRKAAELRWVREVLEERDRLLDGMEVDEIDNGEDIDAWFAESLSEETMHLESLVA
ncbi:hypothetical protein HD806DRAFT_139765 [Xylariaceae sp. AK1471]|nr:hypothetical protein HD806DRAFT_139765 [Xylariaceae sp. AK1471]